MPISLLTATHTMLDSGEIRYSGAARFDLESGSYGFWTGEGKITYNTVDYVGVGGLVEVWDTSEDMEMTAKSIELVLRATPDSGLSPDVLATIEDEVYVQRPLVLSDFFFDEHWAIIENAIVWRGQIQKFTHSRDGNGEYSLRCQADSRELDFTKRGWNIRTVRNQALINPTDQSAKFASKIKGRRIFWGGHPIPQ